MKVILGIDPGSTFTGFGVVNSDGDSILHVSHGVIAPPAKLSFHDRLAIIAGELETLVARIQPDEIVIERIFLGKNADSAFKLGHVRGVAVSTAIRAGAEVVEYAARAVKKGITGNGASTKDQVQIVLFAALGLRNHQARLDASDALALAFYHARNLQVAGRMPGVEL